MDTPRPVTQIQPVDPSTSVLHFPKDHYRHLLAPTEWFWHTGTLTAADGRIFGFEINAACFWPAGFFEVMLTDVQNKKHYQQTAVQQFALDWASWDTTKDWWVKIQPFASQQFVTMNAPQADPTQNMVVKASIKDQDTCTPVTFDLTMSQQGPPFIVWGTGVMPYPPKDGGVLTNNYYYSLTRLQVAGTVTLGKESIAVTGETWMDHEYGYFGSPTDPVLWFLQDMQFENGIHISHFQTFKPGDAPKKGERAKSNATIQFPDGTEYYLDGTCWMTPQDPWTSPSGMKFFLKFKIEIPDFDAVFHVTSLIAEQDFSYGGSDLYEGVAKVEGSMHALRMKGTAWNEQKP